MKILEIYPLNVIFDFQQIKLIKNYRLISFSLKLDINIFSVSYLYYF